MLENKTKKSIKKLNKMCLEKLLDFNNTGKLKALKGDKEENEMFMIMATAAYKFVAEAPSEIEAVKRLIATMQGAVDIITTLRKNKKGKKVSK